MFVKREFIIFMLACMVAMSASAQQIKVACIGNSVTYGMGIKDREVNSYPFQLQQLLGGEYKVENFGKSGATLLRKGHRPYNEQQEYLSALKFAGDKVVIHLGLNDTDPRNWPNYKDEFIADYTALIKSFREVNPSCEVWICRLTPISHRHSRFKSGTRDWYWQIQESIELLASSQNIKLIDLQEGLYSRPELLPDGLHPNAEGATIIAKDVYSAITGDYGGLQMSELYSDYMVLQRDIPLTIEGVANSGDKITLEVAGQKVKTVAGGDGKWSVVLKPLKVLTEGASSTLVVKSANESLTFKEVVIGEVWLCSGQSNMDFELGQSYTAKQGVAAANKYKGSIRLFNKEVRWATNAVKWDEPALKSLNRLEYFKEAEWVECSSESVSGFSAVAYYFGTMLADSLKVPIGLINNSVGGSTTESWISRKTLEFEMVDILHNWRSNDMIMQWARERGSLNISNSKELYQRHPYEPTYLYESAIEPIKDYTIGGVIWYQGESNAHNIELHEKLFPLLISDWRAIWGDNLPFYYVQLSGINRPTWPSFRDSQRKMMSSIEYSGMAVSSDKGDFNDVHPRAKKEVGERLALWALNKSYGVDLVPSGPIFEGAVSQGRSVLVSFMYSDGMRSSDNKDIATFEVAELPGIFYPAKAEVVGDKIKLTSKDVKHPRYLRYGWQPFTLANLVNSANLPASTFESTVDHK